MSFTEETIQLKKLFDRHKDEIKLSQSEIIIHNYSFESSTDSNKDDTDVGNDNHHSNVHASKKQLFRYTVFSKDSDEQFEKAILLIHGLNERKWDKYLSWAKYLVETTNKPVILFPITFQINRTLLFSTARNKMSEQGSKLMYKSERESKLKMTNTQDKLRTSLAEHVALSGFQSVCDILQVVAELKEGKHDLFKENTSIDMFGYSIGAFIAQILLLANPRNLFDNSKFLFFCGGPFFNKIDGGSRFVFSSKAFKRMQQFYEDEIKWKNSTLQKYMDTLSFENIGLAFKAMLSAERFKRFREKIFRQFSNQIHAIALVKDSMISPDNVYNALRGDEGLIPVAINVLDYPYKYTHESPFPVFKDDEMKSTVDSCFNSTFTMVANFLRDK